MISQIAEAISAFFYSMDVIDEEEKGKKQIWYRNGKIYRQSK